LFECHQSVFADVNLGLVATEGFAYRIAVRHTGVEAKLPKPFIEARHTAAGFLQL